MKTLKNRVTNLPEFRDWLHGATDRVDREHNHPSPNDAVEAIGEVCGSVAEEAGDIAARLGLPDLHRQSLSLCPLADPMAVKTFLGECLAACCTQPTSGVWEAPPVMTEDDVIRYLRLDADDRDPHERLRNLVRRQGLPRIRRGKLALFRRAAVDAWLERRN